MNEWKDVKEELPEPGEMVIARISNTFVENAEVPAYRNPDKNPKWKAAGKSVGYGIYSVTAWKKIDFSEDIIEISSNTRKFPEMFKWLLSSTETSYSALAREMGLHRTTISGWADGTKDPRLSDVYWIANHFHVPMEYLV